MRKLIALVAEFIVKIINPHPRITDPEDRYRSRMLNSLLVIYVPMAIVVHLFRFIVTPNAMGSTTLIATGGLIVVAIIYLIGRSGHYRASVYATVILGYGVIYFNAINSAPPYYEISYLIFLPLLGIVLFSIREAFIIYAMTIGLLVIFIATNNLDKNTAIDLVVFMMLTIGFILFANYQRTRLDNFRHELIIQKNQTELVKDLINNVSHDFRTPLSTIRTSTYLLERVDTAEKRQKAIQRIERQTSRLEWMVKNLLIVSRLDYHVPPDLMEVDMKALSEVVISEMKAIAQAKQIVIDSEIDSQSQHVRGDVELLEIMLVNLIENAINYTPENGHITVKLHPKSDAQLQVHVIDNGIGIADEDLAYIFDRFYRVDKARSTDTGGNGLGLSIVKQIVELHQGQIAVTSQLGDGTTVLISLPIYQH